MTSTHRPSLRTALAALAAVAWAMVGAASCARGATESDPLSGSTSTGTPGVGGSGGSGGSGGGSAATGGPMKTPCTKASQCPEKICQGGVCAAATCVNGKPDGTETDLDCGGPACGPCVLGKSCKIPSDCSTGICTDEQCEASDCTDMTKNGSESDVDCGGSACPGCGPGQVCATAADCGGSPCLSGKCKFEVTFTTCTQTGAIGPSQALCDAAYGAGSALKGKVAVTAGYQHFTVPSDGVYQLEAFGAEAGKSDFAPGGAGARMRGDFPLKKGDVLKIVVGQMGSDGAMINVGGGGGTFVAVGADLPLLVAGGGGGYGACGGSDIDMMKLLMAGKSTKGDGSGGTSTGDGNYCGCGAEGSGGGGFTGNGGADGGKSFINGALGCTSKRPGQCSDPGVGGFGGGGNGGNGGAGGGGYQGGNAGGSAGGATGRGGLSYNSGMNPSNADGVNTGHGKLTIKSL